MNFLLDDKFAPITSEFGFLECNTEVAAATFCEWQKKIHAERGVMVDRKILQTDLTTLLNSLLPLTDIEIRRTLFVPTNSQWTAYFDNGWQGGEPASVVSYLSEEIGCQGVRVVCVPHTLNKEFGRDPGRYGATILEIYAPHKIDFLNTKRSICAAFDGNRWIFEAYGEPQPFEDMNKYKAKRIRDRFTPDMLEEYLKAHGIDAFSENFYRDDTASYLVYKEGPSAPDMEEYSLAEARANYT